MKIEELNDISIDGEPIEVYMEKIRTHKKLLTHGGKLYYRDVFKMVGLQYDPSIKYSRRLNYKILYEYAKFCRFDMIIDVIYKLTDEYRDAKYNLPDPTFAEIARMTGIPISQLYPHSILISNLQKDYQNNINIILPELRDRRIKNARVKYHNKCLKNPIKRQQELCLLSRTQLMKTKTETPGKYTKANYEGVKKHLEKYLTDDMNWDNYGRGKVWSISYIVHPRNAKTKTEVRRLNHYKNLFPEYNSDIHNERLEQNKYFSRNNKYLR